MSTPIVRIEHVKQYFPVTKEYTIKALDDVSLTIQPGETVGLIGESGCGKSTLARTIMGLYVPTEGTIFFHDQPISDSRVRRSQGLQIHRGLQMIFQDSDGALNPRMTAEEIIREGLVLAKRCQTQAECTQRVAELLQCVDLEPLWPSLSRGIIRRSAPARGYCTVSGRGSGSHYCRRTDCRVRCVHSSSNSELASRFTRTPAFFYALYCPRFGRRTARQSACCRHVRWKNRRNGTDRNYLYPAGSPVYADFIGFHFKV